MVTKTAATDASSSEQVSPSGAYPVDSGASEEALPKGPDQIEETLKEEVLRQQSEEDAALAAALDFSLNDASDRKNRPGEAFSLPQMTDLGVSFERQPDGSDSCAIHSLNNLVQPLLSPEEAAIVSAARVAASVAAECGEKVQLEGLAEQGPFRLRDLQEAEAEVRREECQDSFLPTAASMLLLRSESGPLAHTRTGMFEVEAVKVAAHNKGYEVIDVEPTPDWADAECGAARYVQTAADLDKQGGERWFLGFLVYERIPGRAMHYYAILRIPGNSEYGISKEPSWLILDGLDRGAKSPRNRLLTTDDLIAFHDKNGEWFRSWLVRWYPVVDRSAAIAAVCKAVAQSAQHACGKEETDAGLLGVSPQRAEVALESETIRWDVSRGAKELLGAVAMVDRELQVLRLAVSEKQARNYLEQAKWDFERAVQIHAEGMLQWCHQEAAEGDAVTTSEFGGPVATYAALHLADWDARAAAQVLLLVARASPGQPQGAACSTNKFNSLKEAASALEACSWDLDRAHAVMRLCGVRLARNWMEFVSKAHCAKLLDCVGFDLCLAELLLDVHHRFPHTPPGVCAEALRRGDDNVPAACALLQEFEKRVQDQVRRAWRTSGVPEVANEDGETLNAEAAAVGHLALATAEWNPAIAFYTAESFALGLLHVRRELLELERRARSKAMDTVHQGASAADQHASPSRSSWNSPGAAPAVVGQTIAAPSEAEVAEALDVLDALSCFSVKAPPDAAEIIEMLQEAAMNPSVAATNLWHRRTGLSACKAFGWKGVAAASIPPMPPTATMPSTQPRPARPQAQGIGKHVGGTDHIGREDDKKKNRKGSSPACSAM